MRFWGATQWIIIACVAVYVIDLLSGGLLSEWGAFSVDRALFHLQLWRIITCAFLHASPSHLVFNMLALWYAGPMLESMLRPRRFVAFYVLSGIGGICGYLLLWRLKFLDVSRYTALVGASACIFGVMMAGAHLWPHRVVRFVPFGITLRLRTLVWGLIAIAILYIAIRDENAGGEAAHLGGAVVGYLLIRNLHWFSAVGLAPKRRRFWKPGDPQSNFFRPDA
jgi:membrane associated rhomboid family serine protease